MQKERKQLEELFQKYRQGLITEEEKKLIARWLIYLDVSGELLTPEQLQAKEELSQEGLRNHFFPNGNQSARIINFPIWLRTVAASLFVIAGIGGIFYFVNKSNQLETVQIAYAETKTATGEMKIVILTDGTKITLNNQSQLRYPVSFPGKTREVFLSGEAFFEVARNPAKPFKVHTDRLNVQVLGTSFDVKAYKDDKELSVAVATGKVGVLPSNKKQANSYMLLPGDQLDYNRSTGEFTKSSVNAAAINGWQKGRLVFKNERLETITRQLERYFKIKFIVQDKALLTKELSLNMKNQSLNVVMKALSISGDFKFKIENNTVTIW